MNEIFLGTAFLAGILSFFSPCVLPLLPIYFSVFAGGEDVNNHSARKKQTIIKTIFFVLGISFCFVLLGFGAGFLGGYIYSKGFLFFMGLVVIILGLHQTGLINIKWLMYEKKLNITMGSTGYLKVFLLGFSFSFGWTPCIGPILGAILAMASSGANPLYSMALTGIFSLGFLIPFLIMAIFSEYLLGKMKIFNKHFKTIKIISGIIIIIMGLMLMSDNVNFIMRYI